MQAVLPSFALQQTHLIPSSHLLHLLYKGFMAQQTNRVESAPRVEMHRVCRLFHNFSVIAVAFPIIAVHPKQYAKRTPVMCHAMTPPPTQFVSVVVQNKLRHL